MEQREMKKVERGASFTVASLIGDKSRSPPTQKKSRRTETVRHCSNEVKIQTSCLPVKVENIFDNHENLVHYNSQPESSSKRHKRKSSDPKKRPDCVPVKRTCINGAATSGNYNYADDKDPYDYEQFSDEEHGGKTCTNSEQSHCLSKRISPHECDPEATERTKSVNNVKRTNFCGFKTKTLADERNGNEKAGTATTKNGGDNKIIDNRNKSRLFIGQSPTFSSHSGSESDCSGRSSEGSLGVSHEVIRIPKPHFYHRSDPMGFPMGQKSASFLEHSIPGVVPSVIPSSLPNRSRNHSSQSTSYRDAGLPKTENTQHSRKTKQRNYKNMSRDRRVEANARERSRVHTISAAFESLRRAVPSYSYNQKLSKLAILRIACCYIMALGKLANSDVNYPPTDDMSFGDCVDMCTKTIQMEGKARRRKVSEAALAAEMANGSE